MFADRHQAGQLLADRLAQMHLPGPVVLALPRGGVPVAAPVAARLGAPLDLILVRKLGVPGHPELAAGAVVEGDPPVTVFNPRVLRAFGLTEQDFEQIIDQRLQEIAARRGLYLPGRAPVPLAGRSAILVDDGIATGATVRAALLALADRGAERIVLVVPVAAPDVLAELRPLVDDLVCLLSPAHFSAVGAHYRDFEQTGDDQVLALLRAADSQHRETRQ